MNRRPRLARAATASRDRWIIPYADFVTLLFAFFTALYAVTSVDASRLPSVAEGVREAVGGGAQKEPSLDGSGILPDHNAIVGNERDREADNARQVRAALERGLADDLLAARLELIEERRGLVLAVPEAFTFDSGGAELSEAAEGLMARVGLVLAGVPNAVRVEGHTDDTPIHTPRFSSNWELSTARATSVVAFFVLTTGLAPDRLSAAGYSEFHPRSDNQSAAGRARNRRVDIVILNAVTQASEEPAKGNPS